MIVLIGAETNWLYGAPLFFTTTGNLVLTHREKTQLLQVYVTLWCTDARVTPLIPTPVVDVAVKSRFTAHKHVEMMAQ